MNDAPEKAPNGRPVEDSEKLLWIERSVLVLLFLGLIAFAFVVVKPFVTAILFAAALAAATWPARMALVRAGLGHRMAAFVLLLVSVALIAVPVLVIAPHLTEQITTGVQRLQAYLGSAPDAPAWLSGLPFIGKRISVAWSHLVASQGNLTTLLDTYAVKVEDLVVIVARAVADSAIQLILALAIATMFWVNGDKLTDVLHKLLQRLGGATADETLDVAADAIRGTAYGVVGTAAIQAVLMTIGLAIAGVPGAVMLGFVTLLLAISQIGAPLLVLIWVGAAWWLAGDDHQIRAGFMVVWGLFVSISDNFIKPWLVSFGVSMPLSLTILGVFGGFVAFGFLGLFIGPVLIAIVFKLLKAWLAA